MKMIFLPLGCKIRTWVRDLRVLSAFLFGITIMLFYAARYVTFAKAMGSSVQCFETYLFLSAQPQSFCFLLLGGLLLLSDAPFLTPLSQQEMIRIGRKKWLTCQVLYIYLSSFLYFFVLELLSFLYSAASAGTYLLGGWSEAMEFLAIEQPIASAGSYKVTFPYPELIQAVSPNWAALASPMLHALYLSLVSLLVLGTNLIFKTSRGWIIGSGFHFLNYLTVANGGFGIPIRYFPLCDAMVTYQQIPELHMPPVFSFCYMLLCNLAIIVLIFLNVNRIEPFQ